MFGSRSLFDKLVRAWLMKSRRFVNTAVAASVAWLRRVGLKNKVSSTYHPASNGLAEAGVKNVKVLLYECLDSKECFESLFVIGPATVGRNGGLIASRPRRSR